MIKNINIYKYNEENLLQVLKNDHISYKSLRENNNHYQYFKEYLGNGDQNTKPGLNAGMIITEEEYISRSYLDDYQEHYFLAYKNYDKECRRVHFFEHTINENELQEEEKQDFLEKILQPDDTSIDFWNGYLGYIIVRPIPRGIVGPTLLKPYHNEHGVTNRNYTAIKKYNINVFGKKISLDTLIYVQQDTMVGACATSAIYVALHKLADLFNTKIPNQKKISDSAGISVHAPNRRLKNKDGLRPFQMCKVIENFGLEPELQDFENQDMASVKSYIYAYLKMQLPVILGISIENLGGHAITITGYQDNSSEVIINSYNKSCFFSGKIKKYPLYLKGSYIKRLYAHDDQIGPFARIGFDDKKGKLISAWWDKEKGIEHKLLADIFISIVPVSKRIRIPFESVYRHIGNINNFLHETIEDLDEVLWDIYLNTSNIEKESLINDDFNYTLHQSFLLGSQPKYLWVADFYISGLKCFKVFYDASGIDEDFSARGIVYFDEFIRDSFKDYFELVFNQELIDKAMNDSFAQDILDRMGIKTINLFRSSLGLSDLDAKGY